VHGLLQVVLGGAVRRATRDSHGHRVMARRHLVVGRADDERLSAFGAIGNARHLNFDLHCALNCPRGPGRAIDPTDDLRLLQGRREVQPLRDDAPVNDCSRWRRTGSCDPEPSSAALISWR